MNQDAYANRLAELEGMDFQEEVCTYLQRFFLDFQRIPAKPHGDGGLDGLSHGQSRGYCCYGPEFNPRKRLAKRLETAIVNKFRADLCKLFELQEARKKVTHQENPEITTILAANVRIQHVYLVVNTFESHQLIGPLNTCFLAYRDASKCRYVDKNSTLAIWGPKDVVAQGAVDEQILLRVQHRAMLARVTRALESEIASVPETTSYDQKFEALADLEPRNRGRVQSIRDRLLKEWAAALVIDRELANTSPETHRQLHSLRERAALTAELDNGATDHFRAIQAVRSELETRLRERFADRLGPDLVERLADGETARLIGECPLGMRSNP